jgi:hypothetical protein
MRDIAASRGPVIVESGNKNYHPAALSPGGSGNTVVRIPPEKGKYRAMENSRLRRLEENPNRER